MNLSNMKSPLSTEMLVSYIQQGVSIDDLASLASFPTLSSCLNEIIGRRNLSVDAVSGLADMNTATLYKIMSRKIAPSRNVLLRLAFSLEMSFDETQVLLKAGNAAALSASRKRDIYIIEGIQKQFSYDDVNSVLTAHGFPDLYSKG